jgi:hypothetical protein
MTKWTLRCVVALCAALLAGASLQAHHSLAGMYALGNEAKVAGAFKAFRLVNPHSAMKFDVKNTDGSTTEHSITSQVWSPYRSPSDVKTLTMWRRVATLEACRRWAFGSSRIG